MVPCVVKVFSVVLVLVVTVSGDDDASGKQFPTQTLRPIRVRPFGYLHHKHGYNHLLHYYAFGALVVLVIIKILLAMSFSGMVSALLHMFAGIKYVLRINEDKAKPTPAPVVVPHYHHAHEYSHSHEYPYAAPEPVYYRRKQAYSGGRAAGEESIPKEYSVGEVKERRKRDLNTDERPEIKERVIRSVETDEPDNCKMKVACQLHARAKLSPFHTFQLYFLKKDGLAQYWDHKDRKFDECGKVYPCGPNRQTIKTEEKHADTKDTPLPSITKVTNTRRQFSSQSSEGSYSTEYETVYDGQPAFFYPPTAY